MIQVSVTVINSQQQGVWKHFQVSKLLEYASVILVLRARILRFFFFLTNISKSYKHLKEIQNKIHMNVLVFKKQSLYLTAHSFSLRENLKIHQTCFLIV